MKSFFFQLCTDPWWRRLAFLVFTMLTNHAGSVKDTVFRDSVYRRTWPYAVNQRGKVTVTLMHALTLKAP
uniref:Putative secreted protein n=1 Tax=Rhipicephalus microplus TaxID=6941 RepID=A0A6G5A0S3_RHIMP